MVMLFLFVGCWRGTAWERCHLQPNALEYGDSGPATLLLFIEGYINPNTIIQSDGWVAYSTVAMSPEVVVNRQ